MVLYFPSTSSWDVQFIFFLSAYVLKFVLGLFLYSFYSHVPDISSDNFEYSISKVSSWTWISYSYLKCQEEIYLSVLMNMES